MANFFSLQDGNLTDSSIYGYSLTGAEMMSNTTGTMLLTSSLYSTNFTNTNADTISALAVHLSARSANPSGTLGLTLQRTANSNKFYDGSSNNLTIATNGTPYQNTFTPFSPNGWSGYFNGTTDALSIANDTAFVLSGNASFTMEAWVFPTKSWSSGSPHPLIDKRDLSNNISYVFSIKSGASGTLAFAVGTGVAGGSTAYDSMSTIPNGSWTHVAASYDGIKLRLYTNGNKVYESASTISIPEVNTQIRIARNTLASPDYYGGGISNFRIIKGTALYTTTSFTPSSSALTNISGTSLLTLQDSRFKDNSNNNFTLTANGSPVIKDSSPFTQVIVDPAVHGGAGYFGGSSSISVPSSTNYEFSTTTDYTIEFWLYPTVLAGSNTAYRLIYYGTPTVANGTNVSWGIVLDSTAANLARVNFWTYTSTAQQTNLNTASIININTWNHFALVTLNGKISAYINGVYNTSVDYTSNMNTNVANAALQIGVYNGSEYFNGYLSNIRLIKNTALYTSNFTPSLSPLTNTNSPVLLLKTNNYGFRTSATETYAVSSFTSYDGSNNLLTNYPQNWQILKLTNPLTANPSDYINYSLKTSDPNQLSLVGASTAVNVAGISRVSAAGTPSLTSFKPYSNFDDSYYLKGLTDWFYVPANPNFALAGDFTIEFWINTANYNRGSVGLDLLDLGGTYSSSTLELVFWTTATSPNVSLGINNVYPLTGTLPVANGLWNHVALVRYNNAIKLFVNGVQSGKTYTNSTNFNSAVTNGFSIGTYNNASANALSGAYINQFRIVNGTAVYTTSAFTPPSAAPLEYIPNTVFLLKNGVNYDQALISNTNWNTLSPASLSLSNTTLTSESPFGNNVDGSIYFNGSSSHLSIASTPVFNFSTGIFTLECWVKYIGDISAARRTIVNNYQSFSNGWELAIDTNGVLIWVSGDTKVITGTTILQPNTWYHVAVAANTTTSTRLFLDGTQEGSTYTAGTAYTTSSPLRMGKLVSSSLDYYWFTGYISNLRIINGTALYTSNFTKPTSPLNIIPQTTTLLINDSSSKISSYYNGSSSTIYNLNIGSSLKGLNTESRVVQADSGSINNIYIYNQGTLNFPLTSNKTLNLNGSAGLQITSDGTVTIGTLSNPISSSITHTITLSNTYIDVHNGGILSIYGSPKKVSTYLGYDVNTGVNSFTTTDSISSWTSSDYVMFIPPSSNRAGFDLLKINTVGDKTFTTTSNTTFSHNSLTSLPAVPTIANVTRNILIQGKDSTNRGVIRSVDAAKTTVCNASLSNFGLNVPLKRGFSLYSNISGYNYLSGNAIDIGSFNGAGGLWIAGAKSYSHNLTFNDNIIYRGSTTQSLLLNGVSAVNLSVNNNFVLSGGNFNGLLEISNLSTYNSNIIKNYLVGSAIHGAVIAGSLDSTSNLSGIVAYNNATVGVYLSSFSSGNVSDITAIYNTGSINGTGILLSSTNPSISSYYGNISNVVAYKNGGVGFTPTAIMLSMPYISANLTNVSAFNNLGSGLMLSGGFNGNLTNASIYNNPINGLIVYAFSGNMVNVSAYNNGSSGAWMGIMFFPSNSTYKANLSNVYCYNNTSHGISFSATMGNIGNFNNVYCYNNSKNGLLLSGFVGNLSNIYTYKNTENGLLILSGFTGNISNLSSYNNTENGMSILNCNYNGIISGINSYANSINGFYYDSSFYNLSGITFKNILTTNNSSVGFKVSGNSLNYLNPIILNIDGLTASNNSSVGIEVYNISGNLSSIVANDNYGYGIKTSIGNRDVIFDNVIALNTKPINGQIYGMAILSGCNYGNTVIKNALIYSNNLSDYGLFLDSTRFSRFSLENSILSTGTPLQINTTRNLLEGSYLINNSYLGSTPLGTGITSKYQPYSIRNTGFAFTNYNQISGYHISYYPNGSISIDYSIYNDTGASERLTPNSSTTKLKSGSKYVALDKDQKTVVGVYLRRSSQISDGTAYNGNNPRLMLRRNASMGIYNDIVIAEYLTSSESFELVTGPSPSVTNDGVLEFYVDCDGTQGWINIDTWSAY